MRERARANMDVDVTARAAEGQRPIRTKKTSIQVRGNSGGAGTTTPPAPLHSVRTSHAMEERRSRRRNAVGDADGECALWWSKVNRHAKLTIAGWVSPAKPAS